MNITYKNITRQISRLQYMYFIALQHNIRYDNRCFPATYTGNPV